MADFLSTEEIDKLLEIAESSNIKNVEIIERLGFKLPDFDICEDNSLEIFFVDRFGIVHGRFGSEAIRWNSKGVSMMHPSKFDLIKTNWWEDVRNFPCLVSDENGELAVARYYEKDTNRVYYTNCSYDYVQYVKLASEQDALSLIKIK